MCCRGAENFSFPHFCNWKPLQPEPTKPIRNRNRAIERLACRLRLAACLLLCLQASLFARPGKENPNALSRLKARAFYYENRLRNDSLPKKEALAALDSLQILYTETGQAEELFRIQKQTISYLQENGTPVEALQACREFLSARSQNAAPNHEDSLRRMQLELRTGILSISAGFFEEGTTHMLNVLRMDAPLWCKTQAYSYMGYILMRNNRPEKSREYHQKALEAYNNLPEDSVKRNQCTLVFNHLAGLYYSLAQYDSAIACIEQALACSEAGSMKQLYAFHNMSLIYMELEEYAKAEEYLRKTIDLARQENPYLHAVSLQNLAELYTDLHRFDLAGTLFRQAIDLSGKMHFNDVLANTLIGYAELLFLTGDCKGFRDYYTAGVAKRDSVTGAANQERIDLINFQHEFYRLESERKILEQNLELTSLSNQKKTVVVISLGLLLLVVTLYMARLIQKLRKQAQENLFINSQMDHIRMEMEKQESDSRNILHTSLEKKNRELASRALYLVQVNDLLQRTVASLDLLKKSDPGRQQAMIERIKEEIAGFNGNVNGWKDFHLYFEQIHQNFYNRLLAEAPNLSPLEQRLCALLASNLTQKEIAEITHRSVRTVETMIYRVRKKLRLPSQVKMAAFLQKFLQD